MEVAAFSLAELPTGRRWPPPAAILPAVNNLNET